MQYIHTLYIFYTFYRILNPSQLKTYLCPYSIVSTQSGSPLYVVIDTLYMVISSPKLILNIRRTAPLII